MSILTTHSKEIAMGDANLGIYKKFDVRRTDGSSDPGGKHENCQYFVLDLIHDRFAAVALHSYGMACRREYPTLSAELLDIAASIEQKNINGRNDYVSQGKQKAF